MKDSFINRKYVIMALMVLATLGLLVKLFIIQVVKNTYRLSADNNVLRYITQYPARGLVYDRNGKLIVYNQAAYDLMVVPAQVTKIDTAGFCDLLGISRELFIKQMKLANNHSRRAASVFLKQVSNETYARFQEKMFLYPGFYPQPRTLRKYSLPVASHVLGYVSEVDDNLIKKNPYYKPGDYIGKSGIEEAYEKDLRGRRGVKIFLVDVFSRIKGSYAEGRLDTLAIQGSDIITGLDLDLQAYGELLMQGKRGSVVAIEPETGEVLALISAPDYDPALLVGRVRSENFAKLQIDTVQQPLFNRALMASYPPGSTFKPIIGLIGLQEGVITPETQLDCHMGYLFVACHKHSAPLSIVGAVGNSCNAFFCQTYRRVLENPAYNSVSDAYVKWKGYLDEFGFGSKLGTDFVNELSGFIPSTNYFDKYYGKNRWKALTVISMGIGQGEVGTTPLQMANMTAAIANRGYYYTPHVVKAVGINQHIDKRFITKHNISIDTANFEKIVLGMEAAVNSGTAASIKIKDIIICGKTGTAQNPHGKDNSVFIGFAPKDNPKIAIAVYVENAGFGATYAAPVASLMMEKFIRGEVMNKALEKRILDLNVEPKLTTVETEH
jgi:penicillin-binding protein 2